MKKCKTVVEAAQKIQRAGMAKVAMTTIPDLTKKSRADGTPTPERLKDLKKVAFGLYPIKFPYCSKDEDKKLTGVKKQLHASGAVPAEFTVEKPKGKHHMENGNGIVLENDDDPNIKYIMMYIQNGTSHANTRSAYINSKGDIINVSQEDLDNYFPKKYPPKKQLEAGIDPNKVVLPITPFAESITYLKKGTVIFGAEDKRMQKIIELMNDLNEDSED